MSYEKAVQAATLHASKAGHALFNGDECLQDSDGTAALWHYARAQAHAATSQAFAALATIHAERMRAS